MGTKIGYKLFEMNKEGKLYPLFINKKESIPIGEWIEAQNVPTKGFSVRPGWHLGMIPDAPWLKNHEGYYTSRWKAGKRVWGIVEFVDDIDYQYEVNLLPQKCMKDRIPENGFYRFREAGGREWIITGKIRVVQILTEEERKLILQDENYNEHAEFAPYQARFEKRMAK